MGTLVQLLAARWHSDTLGFQPSARAGVPALQAHLRRLADQQATVLAEVEQAAAAVRASPNCAGALRRYMDAAGRLAEHVSAQERTEQALVAARLAQADAGVAGGVAQAGTPAPPVHAGGT